MISLNECKHGYIYEIESRNLIKGVFNKESNGFIGIREKFGREYLFTEYHWDTVNPIKELEKIPDDIEIKESLGVVDRETGRAVIFKKYDDKIHTPYGSWYYVDTGLKCENGGSSLENKKLFDFLNQ